MKVLVSWQDGLRPPVEKIHGVAFFDPDVFGTLGSWIARSGWLWHEGYDYGEWPTHLAANFAIGSLLGRAADLAYQQCEDDAEINMDDSRMPVGPYPVTVS